MTLDQILQQCARNTYNQKVMTRTDAGYTGKGLEYAERFVGFINTICQKIARERWAPAAEETVTLNKYGEFDASLLSQPLLRVLRVRYIRDEYEFSIDSRNIVTVPLVRSVEASVLYEFLPPSISLADLDLPLPYPETIIPPDVIYNYATFMFLYQEGTDYDTTRAQPFLNAFNEAYIRILPTAFQRRIV